MGTSVDNSTCGSRAISGNLYFMKETFFKGIKPPKTESKSKKLGAFFSFSLSLKKRLHNILCLGNSMKPGLVHVGWFVVARPAVLVVLVVLGGYHSSTK